MVTKYVVRPSTPEKVVYKSNTEENRKKYANMAYYIDEEEKGRVLSENLKDQEQIEMTEAFLRNRESKIAEHIGLVEEIKKPKEIDVFDQYRLLEEDYRRQ